MTWSKPPAHPGTACPSCQAAKERLAPAAELLRTKTKSRFTHVPFDGGGPALEALLQQRADFYFPVLVTAMPQIKSGHLKALAITSGKRPRSCQTCPRSLRPV